MNTNWRHNATGLDDEKPREAQITLESVLTCLVCGYVKTEFKSTDDWHAYCTMFLEKSNIVWGYAKCFPLKPC